MTDRRRRHRHRGGRRGRLVEAIANEARPVFDELVRDGFLAVVQAADDPNDTIYRMTDAALAMLKDGRARDVINRAAERAAEGATDDRRHDRRRA